MKTKTCFLILFVANPILASNISITTGACSGVYFNGCERINGLDVGFDELCLATFIPAAPINVVRSAPQLGDARGQLNMQPGPASIEFSLEAEGPRIYPQNGELNVFSRFI